jgi:hypothetical protein
MKLVDANSKLILLLNPENTQFSLTDVTAAN